MQSPLHVNNIIILLVFIVKVEKYPLNSGFSCMSEICFQPVCYAMSLFVENTKILCNERDCPQELSLHKFFFFLLKIKMVIFPG